MVRPAASVEDVNPSKGAEGRNTAGRLEFGQGIGGRVNELVIGR
jgi:hypothetical protein